MSKLLILASVFLGNFLYAHVDEIVKLASENPLLRQLLNGNQIDEESLQRNIDIPLDEQGNALLYYSMQESEFKIANLLLDIGADINCLIDRPPAKMLDDLRHPEKVVNPLFMRILHHGIIKRGTRPIVPWVDFLCRYHYLKKQLAKTPKAKEVLIPRIIHQIWIGPKPVPHRVKWMMKTWKENHPHWEYRLWTNKDARIFPMVNRDAFNQCTNWGAKADIFRCEILEVFGGVYVDIDFESLVPLDALNERYDFYCGLIEKGAIANGLIAIRPHHPIIKECMNAWQKQGVVSTNNPDEIMASTGPYFFTDKVMAYLSSDGVDSKAIVLPETYFFPFPGTQRADFWNGMLTHGQILQKYCKPETFAIHYWGTSWQ